MNVHIEGHINWTNSTANFITTGTLSAGAGTFTSVKVGDGAVGTPSLGFTSDTDTGFYWGEGPIIYASLGGVAQFRILTQQIGIKDTLSANFGAIAFGGTALTASRLLTIDMNDAGRTLDLTGNSTLNQDVSTAGSPTFAGMTLDFATQDYLFTSRDGTYLAIQGQTSNLSVGIDLFTKDGDGVANESMYINCWGKGLPASTTNREIMTIGYVGTAAAQKGAIFTQASGTGTVRPLYLYTGANTSQLVLNIDGSNSMAGALGVTGAVTGGSFSTAGDITTTAGTLYVPGSIIHYGDADTLIAFSAPDQYYFQAGGWQFMLLSKSAKSQSALTINAGQEDLDTTISGVTEANLFRVDAATDTVRMGDWDTNYTQWTSAGVQTMAGTARVTKQIWLPYNALKEPGTKPATFKEWGISGAWEFSDATDDTIVFNIAFPEDMDMSVAPVMCVGWSTNTAVDTETATWQLEYLYTQAGEDTTAVAQGTITVDSNAIAQANGLIIAQLPAMGVPNAADICLHGRLKRLGAGGNDDLTDTAELHGVSLQYTSNKLGTGT